MTVQGMFQPSGDQYDPQKQSDAEGDQKRQMETADRRHGFVIQSQQEKEIRHADSWKDKRCRSDKSCKNKQKKTGISGGGSCLEEIRATFPESKVETCKIGIISVIGTNMRAPGFLTRAAKSLYDAKINVLALDQTMRQVNIQFMLNRDDFKNAQIVLHREFVEKK